MSYVQSYVLANYNGKLEVLKKVYNIEQVKKNFQELLESRDEFKDIIDHVRTVVPSMLYREVLQNVDYYSIIWEYVRLTTGLANTYANILKDTMTKGITDLSKASSKMNARGTINTILYLALYE